jgi:sortase (surface protein transpeptidase)
MLAHTTPWGWEEQGVFNNLIDVHVGDRVAITTNEGRLCYNVIAKDTETPKNQLNITYSKEEVKPGIVYLITCSRAKDLDDWLATKDNLVLTLQLDQQATNTGSC